MSPVRIIYTLGFFFALFVIQESAVSLIHFPISGFSLYLALAISLIAFEDHNGAIVTGFLAGIVLDLSPTSNAPFGQWALILTSIAFLFAVNRDSIADVTSSPITFVIVVAGGVTLALVAYLIFGSLLGEENGSLGHDATVLGGNLLWTVIFTPMFLPALRRGHEYSLTARER
ncbi:MAG: rod shape-determining protein MreD [Actinomycetes bacterium]|jgi:rod shape-determining protein MreD